MSVAFDRGMTRAKSQHGKWEKNQEMKGFKDFSVLIIRKTESNFIKPNNFIYA